MEEQNNVLGIRLFEDNVVVPWELDYVHSALIYGDMDEAIKSFSSHFAINYDTLPENFKVIRYDMHLDSENSPSVDDNGVEVYSAHDRSFLSKIVPHISSSAEGPSYVIEINGVDKLVYDPEFLPVLYFLLGYGPNRGVYVLATSSHPKDSYPGFMQLFSMHLTYLKGGDSILEELERREQAENSQ